MKRQYHSYGLPDVLTYGEIEKPIAGHDASEIGSGIHCGVAQFHHRAIIAKRVPGAECGHG